MKGIKKFIIIFLLILVIGIIIVYYFPSKNIKPINKPIEVNSTDQVCEVDEDCIMAMVECSCDCGVPINKIHWQKYLDAQEKKCKNYDGPYCKVSCAYELRCINNICTVK